MGGAVPDRTDEKAVMSTVAHHVLDVWSDLKMAELLRTLEGVRVRSAGSASETTALHDATDLRLVRSGVQLLRSKSNDGDLWDLTVEPSPFWHKDLGALPVRWIAPATGSAAPEAVVGALRTSPLTEVLVERTTARAWTVTRPLPAEEQACESADAAPQGSTESDAAPDQAPDTADVPADSEPTPAVVVVTLNDLAVLRSRRIASRRAQVVVEGEPDLAADVVTLLEAHGGEAGEPGLATLEVLGSRAERPVVPIELEDHPSIRAVVRVAFGRSVARVLANDIAIRLELGPEAVHQARVATRRLRSDMRTLRPVLDERWANVIDRELRWLAGLLGELRDVDVLQERIGHRVEMLADADHEVGAQLVAALDADRDVAADALHRAFDSHRYARLLDGLVEAADVPQVVSPDADARPVLRDLVQVPWNQLRKRARKALDHDSPVLELHEMRIRAKRVRYAFDIAGLVFDGAARHGKRVACLQDELGELHDAAVCEEWLRSRMTRHGMHGAFVIGVICAQELAEIERRRESWIGAWERADSSKTTKWLRH
jgi:CHAD domain-containing protein